MTSIVPLTEQRLPSDGYIFKHSTACPISAAAADEVRSHVWTLPVYWINVIEQRPLSNWVSEVLGVRHESPQLIELKDGKVVRTLNHRAITRSAF